MSQAQSIAVDAAAGFLRATKQQKCPRQGVIHDVNQIQTWPKQVEVSRSSFKEEQYGGYTADAGFIATAQDVGIYGSEGVLASEAASCQLEIYGSSSYPFAALHAQFWLVELWKQPTGRTLDLYDHYHGRYPPPQPNQPTKTMAKAATVVSFASTNYYHFVLEANAIQHSEYRALGCSAWHVCMPICMV